MWRKGNLCVLLVGSQISAATMENSIKFLKNLKTELPYDMAIPLLGIYLKKSKTRIQKRHMHPYVECSTMYDSQDMEAI